MFLGSIAISGIRQDAISVLFIISSKIEGFILKLSRQQYTVKILKIGTPEIITIIVLQLEQLDFTVQYCVQKMQTE